MMKENVRRDNAAVFTICGYTMKAPLGRLEIGGFGVFELELEFICDEGDELAIGRLALCIADRVPEEALEGV